MSRQGEPEIDYFSQPASQARAADLSHTARTVVATVFALLAFAFNSILCRLALGPEAIDALGFTVIRLSSGALILGVLLMSRSEFRDADRGSWCAALMLFLYAICFSLAYLELDTASGALILFAAVQITMIAVAILRGERPGKLEWLGIVVAMSGLAYLLLPGAGAPSVIGFLFMAASGVAWAGYTLLGRGSTNAIADTSWNFVRTLPLAGLVLVWAMWQGDISVTGHGVLLAVLSGALASGLGYCAWYLALGGLAITQAAVLQLSVPVIAALGGVFIVAEPLGMEIAVAGLVILGGIAMVLYGRQQAVMK